MSSSNNNSSSPDQGGILRKFNPMKLIDAGASAISGAVRAGGSSVADRITSLRRREDATSTASIASHAEVITAFSLLRCTVTPTDGSTSVDNASFNIQLLDKRSNLPVSAHPVTRKWRECENVMSMISSLFPRLEGLPAAPGRTSGKGGAAGQAEIEERRRYVQQCLTVMFAHSGAAGTRDLQKFLKFGVEDGLGSLNQQNRTQTPSPNTQHPPPSLQQLHQHQHQQPSPSSVGSSSKDNKDRSSTLTPSKSFEQKQQQQQKEKDKQSSGQQLQSLPRTSSNLTRTRSSSQIFESAADEDDAMPEHFDEKELIFDVFHLVDDDGSGYLDTEELEPFFTSIPKDLLTRGQIEQCLLESDKEQTGVVDIRNFRSLCTHLVNTAKRPLVEIVRPFRSQHIARLYEALSTICVDPDPPPMEIQVDREEAKPLLLVISNVGLRSITPSEVAKQELALPMALTEFDLIMDALLYSMSFSELLKALADSKGDAKTLKLINRSAARAHPKALKLLKERIAKACPESAVAAAIQQTLALQSQPSINVIASCSGCEGMKKKIADLEKQLAEAQRQLANSTPSSSNKKTSGDDGGDASAMNPKVSEMIRAQLDEAVTELELSHHRIDQLQELVTQLEEENQTLREKREKEDEETRRDQEGVDAEELGFTGNEAFLRGAGGGGNGAFSSTTLYLLPSNVPSNGLGGDGWRRGVIDRAGALTYQGFAQQQRQQDILTGRVTEDGHDITNPDDNHNDSEDGDDFFDDDNDDNSSASNSRSPSDYFNNSLSYADNNNKGGRRRKKKPEFYQPMGWTVDIYLVDNMGVEHMACRDKNGRRSIAWTIERGKLSCPWSRTVIAQLPVGKWVRLTAQIHWADGKYVTWVLDGKTVLQRQPFRDAQAEEISTLDLYPRSSLVACYANMRFFR